MAGLSITIFSFLNENNKIANIDTVWLDTHENVTKIDQDTAQHPTLSRNIHDIHEHPRHPQHP